MESKKITKIEAFNVQVPLKRPLKLGAMIIPNRHYVIVRIHDNYGNCGTSFGLSRNAPVAETLLRTIAPIWLDKSLDDHDEWYEHTLKANVCLGTNGIFFRALSLFDCALHDLLAIRAKMPLYRMLGGEAKKMNTMLVGGYPSPDENEVSLARQMEMFGKLNPSGVKIASTTNPAKDGERLAICRKYLDDKIPLMIDCVWAQRDATAFAKEVSSWEKFNMGWVEDPFLMDDYDSIRYLAEHAGVTVAVGDEQSGYLNMLRLMDQGKVGVLRLDATVCGGIRSFLKIADEAHKRGVPVACHIFHHTHLHLACALPAVKWIEYMLPESDIESYQLLWHEDLTMENGTFYPTEAFGVGTKWNDTEIDKYKIKSQ